MKDEFLWILILLNNEQVKALYDVKLAKMAMESEEVIGSVIEDTVEISQEAMNKYLAEVGIK